MVTSLVVLVTSYVIILHYRSSPNDYISLTTQVVTGCPHLIIPNLVKLNTFSFQWTMREDVTDVTPSLTGPDLVQPLHDDVIKWKHFPRYWPFVRGIHRSPVR